MYHKLAYRLICLHDIDHVINDEHNRTITDHVINDEHNRTIIVVLAKHEIAP